MAKLRLSLILAIGIASVIGIAAAQDDEKEDTVGGLFLYRTFNNGEVEYLLQQKTKNKAWTLPKGRSDPGESPGETAVREAKEETSWEVGRDFVVDWEDQVYFEYEKPSGKTAKVTLWPAKLKETGRPLQLSEEHTDYVWLDYDKALQTVEANFKDALVKGNDIIARKEKKEYGFYITAFLGRNNFVKNNLK